jgi:hypothetical protein
LDSSGNCGIGTTSPGTQLTLNKNDNNFLQIRSSDTGNAGIYFGRQNDSVRGAIVYDNSNESIQFLNNNYVERMRIDSSGNVGIGASSPSYKLDVWDTGGGNIASFTNGVNADLRINCTSGVTLLTPSTGTLAFGTSNTERMRIDSSGKLLLNTTASFAGEALQVTGITSGSSDYAIIVKGGAASTNYALRVLHSTGGVVGSITFSSTSTAYNTSSDYRLKENVDYDFTALDRVAQLKPARFNFIADADTTVDGFLAHEVQDIVPESVTGEKDGEEMQGIDQSKLVPLLTKAIQEQQTIIESLTARIETLEG